MSIRSTVSDSEVEQGNVRNLYFSFLTKISFFFSLFCHILFFIILVWPSNSTFECMVKFIADHRV